MITRIYRQKEWELPQVHPLYEPHKTRCKYVAKGGIFSLMLDGKLLRTVRVKSSPENTVSIRDSETQHKKNKLNSGLASK